MRFKTWMGTLTVAGASLLLTVGCSLLPPETPDSQVQIVTVPPDIPQVLYTVKKGNIVQQTRAVGRVTGIRDAELTFTKSRLLSAMNVKVGDKVTAGEVLAQLDDQGQQVAAEQAQIALERAQIQLQQAEANAKGNLDSYDKQLMELNIQSAQIAYDDAQSQLGGLDMAAPFSGIVLQVNANPGQYVNAGTTIIQITDPSSVALKVPFTKDQAQQLKLGMKAKCVLSSAPTITYMATLTELPNFSSNEPSVTSTDNSGSGTPSSPTADAVFHFDKPMPTSTLGDSVDTTVILAEHDNVLELPSDAVRQMGNNSFVITYQGDQKKEVPVTIGLQSPTETEIVKGVTLGEKVVGK